MSIRLVVTGGFGNGTFNGTIKDVVTMGFTIAEVLGPTLSAVSLGVSGEISLTSGASGELSLSAAASGEITVTLGFSGEIG